MNILKRELRAGLKPFLFWTIGLFVLVFAGMIKYTGVSAGGASIGELIDQFPRVVQAVLGIVGINIETLGGYYAIIAYFAAICTSIYAISLGAGAVNREAVDKTYEFLFTKPCTRGYVLMMKLASSVIYLVIFSILNFVFSVSATGTLNLDENLNFEMLLFSIAVFLIGLVFFGLAACLSAAVRRAEKGFLYGNLCFLFAFVVGILYDMLENGGILRVLSPIKYFLPGDLLSGEMDFVFVLLCIVITVITIGLAFYNYNKKDLSAA